MKKPASSLASLMLPAVLALSGCYNPKDIKNGGLVCGDGGACPTGYSCQLNHCWKDGADAVAPVEPKGDAGAGLTCPAPFGPFAQCSVNVESGSTCDPVCQAGCTCSQRCQLGSGGFVCRQFAPASELGDGDNCDPNNDLCRPGRVCMYEMEDACGAHCYRFCRTDSDCPANSKCRDSITVGNPPKAVSQTVLTCSPPTVACSPVTGVGAVDTCAARSGFACYVYGQALPNEATCECAGTLTAGQSCTDLHSCRPGLECAGTPLQCRRLCSLQLGVTACGTLKCVSLFGSTKWGTCQ